MIQASKTAKGILIIVLSVTLATITDPAFAGPWKTKAPMPNPRSGPAVEAINGIVYVAGGYNGGDTATLQAYDPTTNSWQILANMPGGRYAGNGAGVINSQLYVAGGWTTSPGLPNNTLFVYDPPTNTWTSKAPMSHLSGCGATGVIKSKLYVTTACDGFNGYRNFLDMYDPLANTWTGRAPSISEHAQPAFGVINDKLYVSGGINNAGQITNILEVYDPATNGWTALAPMPVAVVAPASVALNGKLYVFGGSNGTSDVGTVQVYDPHLNTWKVLKASMPTPRSNAGAAVTYGIGFVEGGASGGTANEDFIIKPSIP